MANPRTAINNAFGASTLNWVVDSHICRSSPSRSARVLTSADRCSSLCCYKHSSLCWLLLVLTRFHSINSLTSHSLVRLLVAQNKKERKVDRESKEMAKKKYQSWVGLEHRYAKPVIRFLLCFSFRLNSAPSFARSSLCHKPAELQKYNNEPKIKKTDFDRSVERKRLQYKMCYKRRFTKTNACQWMKYRLKPERGLSSSSSSSSSYVALAVFETADLLAQVIKQNFATYYGF